jgi:hypothetical protein
LAARGIPVRGIELSPALAERLSAKPGADDVPVTIGDMTTARVPDRTPFTSDSGHQVAVFGKLAG